MTATSWPTGSCRPTWSPTRPCGRSRGCTDRSSSPERAKDCASRTGALSHSLTDLKPTWELLVDGEVADRGVLAVPEIAGHASATIPLPEAALDPDPDRDAYLTVRWETVHDTWFAPAGHVMAWDQVELARAGNPARRPPGGSPADHLVSPTLNLWRAPTDNDGFKLMPELSERLGVGGRALHRWKQAGLHSRPADELVAHRVQVERDDHGTTYRHTVEVPEELADLPRIGVRFELPSRFRELRWYGRGPHENYPDRNRSATDGRLARPARRAALPGAPGVRAAHRLPVVRDHRPRRWRGRPHRRPPTQHAELLGDPPPGLRPVRGVDPVRGPAPRRPGRVPRRRPTGVWAPQAADRACCPSTGSRPGATSSPTG